VGSKTGSLISKTTSFVRRQNDLKAIIDAEVEEK
jgi:hypothetical protein